MRVVITGNSAAGLSVAETVRRLSASVDISIVTDEPYPSYLRCLLGEILTGESDINGIIFRPAYFYKKNKISIVNATAIAIEHDIKKIRFADGRQLGYDRLVIATGASPAFPDVAGKTLQGVFSFHQYKQAAEAAKVAETAKRAVVIGAGLVGLKAAWALRQKGVDKVTVIEKAPWILSRQLDEESAFVIEQEFLGIGIEVIKDAGIASFKGREQLSGVILDSGRELPADLALIAVGTRANVDLIRDAGGKVNKGICVDRHLQTSIQDIYAAGDCIEVQDVVSRETVPSALWPLAVEQGRYAACNLLGKARIYPAPLVNMNACQLGKTPFISAGSATGDICLAYRDDANGILRKLFFKDERLTGYILIGTVSGAGVYTHILKHRLPAGKYKHELLEGTISAADLMRLP